MVTKMFAPLDKGKPKKIKLGGGQADDRSCCETYQKSAVLTPY
jgi:hypothetical protein